MIWASTPRGRGKIGLKADQDINHRFRKDVGVAGNEEVRQRILILGAGFFAEEIADVIAGITSYELVGFVEGLDRQRCHQPLLGLPVYWIEDLAALGGSCRAVCAVGSPKRDGFIRQAQAQGSRFTTVVHPSAQIFPTAHLGEGCIVSAGVIVGSHTTVGRHVLLNRGALIGHHVHLDDYVTVSPGANIAGKTTIGLRTHVAMGAIVIDGISIGRDCLIAAGAVVTHDVPDGTRVAGVPARVMTAAAPK
jgi:sugar O-acyltransferase (sialic acid O-acetyltransferase NeuD family)